MASCPQCGAPAIDGGTCRDAFDRLLAIEFEDPAAFAPAHHLTVAAYSLQHAAGHTSDALTMWRRLIADVLDGRATGPELIDRARRRFDGATRVREAGAEPPPWWPRRWPVRAPDAVPPAGEPVTADGHVARVRRWATAIRATLDAADPGFLA